MSALDDFKKPDLDGFAAIKQRAFVSRHQMIFFESTDFRLIDEMLKSHDALEVQHFFNHIHLSQCVHEIGIQRIWAEELIESWRNRFRVDMPNVNFACDVDDNGNEVIVTLLAKVRVTEG